jgi:transposase
MVKSHNGRYSKEFRCEAVKLVVEDGISAHEASGVTALERGGTARNRNQSGSQ